VYNRICRLSGVTQAAAVEGGSSRTEEYARTSRKRELLTGNGVDALILLERRRQQQAALYEERQKRSQSTENKAALAAREI
jgi:hypothetical protein